MPAIRFYRPPPMIQLSWPGLSHVMRTGITLRETILSIEKFNPKRERHAKTRMKSMIIFTDNKRIVYKEFIPSS